MNPKTHKLFALSSPISSPFSTPPGSRDGVRPTFKGGRLPWCRGSCVEVGRGWSGSESRFPPVPWRVPALQRWGASRSDLGNVFWWFFLGWVFLVYYIYILRCQIHHIYFTIYSLYMFTCLYMPIWMSIYAFVIMNACEISICTATRLASFIFVREDSVKTGWCIIPIWTFPWLTTSPVKILHEGSLVKLLTPSAVTGLWRIGSCYASCWWSTLAKHVWPDAFDPTYNLEISPWRDKKSRYWSKATAWSNKPINRLLLSKDSPSPHPPINTQPCPNLADWSIWTASCQQGQQDAAQELPSCKSESASLLAAWSSFGHPHSAWQEVQFNKVQSSTVLSRSLTNTKITSNKNTIRYPYENNVTCFLVNPPTI